MDTITKETILGYIHDTGKSDTSTASEIILSTVGQNWASATGSKAVTMVGRPGANPGLLRDHAFEFFKAAVEAGKPKVANALVWNLQTGLFQGENLEVLRQVARTEGFHDVLKTMRTARVYGIDKVLKDAVESGQQANATEIAHEIKYIDQDTKSVLEKAAQNGWVDVVRNATISASNGRQHQELSQLAAQFKKAGDASGKKPDGVMHAPTGTEQVATLEHDGGP